MAAPTAGMASFLANMRIPDGVNPVKVTLPAPPKLEGALAPNSFLSKAVRFADNMVQGPESMVVVNGYVYTGLSDGWVVEVSPQGNVRKIRRMSLSTCGTQNAREDSCGRPLGIRADKEGFLIVADAYNGIFRINPVTGQYWQLVYARNERVNGKPLGFINDLAVASDGTIFFTSSSTKWTRTRYLDIILEGETSGRVLVYNPRAPRYNRVQELVTNLNFPNGLELSADENFLLINEAARARIFKAYIGQNSPKRGRLETFAENLPGFPDNIRRTSRGTYWVGISSIRHEGDPSVLDEYGDKPNMRGAIMGMPRDQILQQAPKYAIAVELDSNGKIIRSLHDPTGALYTSVSELQEENDKLYIGSFDKKFIGTLKLSDLPAPVSPTDLATENTTPVPMPMDGTTAAPNIEQQLGQFISQIRQRLMPMRKNQVDSIVIALVQALVKSKVSEMKEKKRNEQLQKRIDALEAQILQMGGTIETTTALPLDGQGTTQAAQGTTTGTTTGAAGTTGSATTSSSSSSSSSGQAGTTQASSGAGTTQAAGSGTTAASAASGTTQASAGSGTTQASAGSGTTQASAGSGTTQAAASGTTQASSGTTSGAPDAGTTSAAPDAGTTIP